MEYLAKKSISFLQDRAFTSNNIDVYTSKWNILQNSRFPFCKIAHLLVLILMFILVNGISCKKAVSFLQDRSFTSKNINVYTSKWNILQKRHFPFRKMLHLSVIIFIYTSKWNILQKSCFPFCKMLYLLVIIFIYTCKWNILQKSCFPFYKIAYLLAIILMFILVNGISCKKAAFLFVRSRIY